MKLIKKCKGKEAKGVATSKLFIYSISLDEFNALALKGSLIRFNPEKEEMFLEADFQLNKYFYYRLHIDPEFYSELHSFPTVYAGTLRLRLSKKEAFAASTPNFAVGDDVYFHHKYDGEFKNLNMSGRYVVEDVFPIRGGWGYALKDGFNAVPESELSIESLSPKEEDLVGAEIVSIDTQRNGFYQPQIIVKKGDKKYSLCTSVNGSVQITEVKD